MKKAILLSENNLQTLAGRSFRCLVVGGGKVWGAEAKSVTSICDPTAPSKLMRYARLQKRLKKQT